MKETGSSGKYQNLPKQIETKYIDTESTEDILKETWNIFAILIFAVYKIPRKMEHRENYHVYGSFIKAYGYTFMFYAIFTIGMNFIFVDFIDV